MSHLADMIEKEQMIGVKVDTQNIINIMRQINNKVKEQDRRLAVLEALMPTYVSAEQHMKDFIRLDEAGQLNAQYIKNLQSSTKEIQAILDGLQVNLTEMLDNRINDLIVTTSVAQKNNFENLDSRINQLTEELKIASASSKKTQNSLNSYVEKNKAIPSQVTDLGHRVEYLYSQFTKTVAQAALSSNKSIPLLAPDSNSIHANEIVTQKFKVLEERLAILEEKAQTKKPILPPLPPPPPPLSVGEVKSMINEDIAKRFEQFEKDLNQSFGSKKQVEVKLEIPKNPETISPSQFVEFMTTVKLNQSNIFGLKNQLGILQARLEEAENNANKNTARTMARKATAAGSFDSTFGNSKKIDDLGNEINDIKQIMESLNDDIEELKAKNQEINNTHNNYRKIIYGLIDGINTIHKYADGLSEVPPQNLRTIAPDYFNDDQYDLMTHQYCMRFPPKMAKKDRILTTQITDSEDSSEHEDSSRAPDVSQIIFDDFAKENPIKEEPEIVGYASFKNTPLRLSGLLHLVSVSSTVPPKKELPKRMETKTVEHTQPEKMHVQFIQNPANLAPSGQMVISDIQNDHDTLPEGIGEDTLRELRFLLGQFQQQRDQLITEIDRKVDRDMVEKLFNKFRVIIAGMNDKIKTIQDLSTQFATQRDVENMTRKLAPDQDQASVIKKKGITCLFCGQTRQPIPA